MKSLIAFSQVLVQELGQRCRVSTSRDRKTISVRSEHEGTSFLTLTLPRWGKDLLEALDLGAVTPNHFSGAARSGGLPRFLGGFLELVFDRSSGRLLDEPSFEAIRALHQIFSAFGKIQLKCSDARERAAFDRFVECDAELSQAEPLPPDVQEAFERISLMLYGDMLSRVDKKVYEGELRPKHGPGATAERLSSNGRYAQLQWTERLEDSFPFLENLFPNHGWYHTAQSVTLREPGDELPVRVVSVPKTLSTPRIIAIEPSYMQYVQQGIAEAIGDEIMESDILRDLVGFRRDMQVINQRLARTGSLTGTLATLDLKEASDRVDNRHVQLLLRHWPHLKDGVDACRSRTADVPGHGVIRLAKFASMGSALTFPIECMVFLTVVLVGIERALRRRLAPRDLQGLRGSVRVYGDDIIVPVEFTNSVSETLGTFGYVVNRHKSFASGKFRESCGGDFYDGRWITPVRVRREFATDRTQVHNIVSMVSLRNQLFSAGYVDTVSWLDRRIERLLPIYPEIPTHVNALGRHTHGPVWPTHYDARSQRPFVKAPVLVSRSPIDPLGDHGALMKWFLKRGDLPFVAKDHLARAGRPEAADIKLRRVAVD